ncbi:MAG: NYN domain-containing protein, partial [Polyangiaceae bacterium]|nr:NYN domain-containing protein [Polyangiaceae bacterium]
SVLWGAHYYTGVETGLAASSEGQMKLNGFLDMLEMQPGYFVMRFPRKPQSFSCASCGAENRYTQEKEVDTTMVADILRDAAIGAYDTVVLMSGDADYAPAVEGVRAIGRQALVATWGGAGLSSRIRRVAFDHIDLLEGLSQFERADDGMPASTPLPLVTLEELGYGGAMDRASGMDPARRGPISRPERDAFLDEVRRAEERFQGGYVGVNYFVTRWASEVLDELPESRRRVLDVLVEDGAVEVYEAPDGKKALRVAEGAPLTRRASIDGSPPSTGGRNGQGRP